VGGVHPETGKTLPHFFQPPPRPLQLILYLPVAAAFGRQGLEPFFPGDAAVELGADPFLKFADLLIFPAPAVPQFFYHLAEFFFFYPRKGGNPLDKILGGGEVIFKDKQKDLPAFEKGKIPEPEDLFLLLLFLQVFGSRAADFQFRRPGGPGGILGNVVIYLAALVLLGRTTDQGADIGGKGGPGVPVIFDSPAQAGVKPAKIVGALLLISLKQIETFQVGQDYPEYLPLKVPFVKFSLLVLLVQEIKAAKILHTFAPFCSWNIKEGARKCGFI
jgi:hypothetical protein